MSLTGLTNWLSSTQPTKSLEALEIGKDASEEELGLEIGKKMGLTGKFDVSFGRTGNGQYCVRVTPQGVGPVILTADKVGTNALAIIKKSAPSPNAYKTPPTYSPPITQNGPLAGSHSMPKGDQPTKLALDDDGMFVPASSIPATAVTGTHSEIPSLPFVTPTFIRDPDGTFTPSPPPEDSSLILPLAVPAVPARTLVVTPAASKAHLLASWVFKTYIKGHPRASAGMILSTVMAYWYRAAIPAQHLITEASKEAKELVTLSTKTQAVAQKSRFNPKVIAILTSIVLPALAYKYNDLIPERIKQVISKRILDPIIGPILEPFLLSVFGYYSFPSNSPSPKLEAIPFAQNTPPKTPLPSNSSSTSTSPLLSSTASTTSSSLSCSSESSRTSQITGSISRSSNTTPLPLSTSTTSTSPPSLSRTSPASQAKAHSSHTDNIKISLDNEKEPQRALRDVGQFDVSSFLERTATLNETQQKNAFTSLSADQRELVMEAINKPSELTKAQKLPANGVGGPQVEQMDVRSTTASTSNSTPSSTSCLSSTSLSPVTSVSSTLTTSNTSKASTSPSLLRPMTNQAVSSFIRRLSQQTTDREKEAMWKELRGKHQAQVQEEIAARKKAELASTSRPSSLTQTTPSPSPASVRTVRSMLSGLVDFIGL